MDFQTAGNGIQNRRCEQLHILDQNKKSTLRSRYAKFNSPVAVLNSTIKWNRSHPCLRKQKAIFAEECQGLQTTLSLMNNLSASRRARG